MKNTIALALVSLLVAACADDPEKLATCKGPVFALNTGHWLAQPAELVKPKSAGDNE